MDWRSHVRSKLPQLRVPPEREIEIIEELAEQLESTYQRERSGGSPHDIAMLAVEREVPDWMALATTLGAIEPQRASAPRPSSSGGFMNGFFTDMRFAMRSLRRTPAFTAVAVTTLAIGLGMAAAAFSVIDTVLIKPLRFGAPDRLVLVHATVPPDGRDTNEIAFPDGVDLAGETQAFKSMALVIPYSGTATALDPPERVTGYNVTPSLFDTLGVQPVLGRAFTADESQPGRSNVVILGHGFWTRLGSRTDIIGQTLTLDDVPSTIVGVMPADFRIEVFTAIGAVYRPMPPDLASAPRTLRGFRAIARLQDSATIEQASSVAAAVGERLAAEYPNSNRGRTFSLSPLHYDVTASVRPALFLIAGMVLLVLLIAGVNLTNLLLARAMARAREVAVRSALGASAWRLARGSLVEAGLLAVLGAAAGVGIACAIVSALVTMPGVTLPRLSEVGLDWRAIAALGITAVAASIGVGAVPFLMHRRLHNTAALRTGHETTGRWEGRIRSALVSAQTALAFVLVAATALLGISLQKLLAVPSGFDPGIATMRIAAPTARYQSREQTVRFYTDLVDEIAAQPGITKAGFVSILPLSGNTGSVMTVQGREDIPMTQRPEVGWMWADPGYFETMGMPIISGRGFTRADLESTSHVTVISATLARLHFGNEDPVGKRVYFGGIPQTGVPEWHEIIGVVGDVRHRSLETEPDARAYDLFGQHWGRTVSLAMRANTSAPVAAGTVRAVLSRRDPRLAVFAVQSTDEILGNAVATRRLLLSLVAAFAIAGFAVAMLGVYGVVSCLVAERQREIGIRVALGATATTIHRRVLGHGFKLVGFGLIAGVAGAIALRRGIEAQLFGVTPTSIPALAGVALALLLAAAIPCLIVSRRATRIDPVRALRAE